MKLVLACQLFFASFAILGASYHALPLRLPVMRQWIGHPALWAPKSLFMVFRVPLMNLIHGLMAAVMLSRAQDFAAGARRNAYVNLFTTLLFTVAVSQISKLWKWARRLIRRCSDVLRRYWATARLRRSCWVWDWRSFERAT